MIKERDRYISPQYWQGMGCLELLQNSQMNPELEKANNGVIRSPHSKKDELLFKTGLFEKRGCN
jgi:F420-dependent methylenetetrahydromethanopterin dehydrogenase